MIINVWLLQWASLCNAFLVEAKWFTSGHLPKAEEYLKNGIISSGVHVVLAHMFFLLGDGITPESVDLVDDHPGISSSIATILRLSDDLGSAKVTLSSSFYQFLICFFFCHEPFPKYFKPKKKYLPKNTIKCTHNCLRRRIYL